MANWVIMGILLVVAVSDAVQDRLFAVNVNFKPNSSKLLEISFEREAPFSVLTMLELLLINGYVCFLKQNGFDRGHFVQNGPDHVAPFTIFLSHDICKSAQNLSIRCEIESA